MGATVLPETKKGKASKPVLVRDVLGIAGLESGRNQPGYCDHLRQHRHRQVGVPAGGHLTVDGGWTGERRERFALAARG